MRESAPRVWIAPEAVAAPAPPSVLDELRDARKRLDDLVARGAHLTSGELVSRLQAIRHRLLLAERRLTDGARPGVHD